MGTIVNMDDFENREIAPPAESRTTIS